MITSSRPDRSFAAGIFLAAIVAAASSGQEPESRPDTRPLANEKSPYLRQHLDNPVNWYPWSDEAFAKAARENKPVFLSIGYASCHWCHVMEKESFENADLARMLNESYVSIKVDREERPDVDRVYMQAAMTMTGRGGWPLSLFLTADRKPFFAGTYFPLEDRPNQTGFRTIVASIRDAWKSRRDALVGSAERLDRAIRMAQLPAAALETRAQALEKRLPEEAATRPENGPVASELAYVREILARKQGPAAKNLLLATGQQLIAIEDKTFGGFGDETKFPMPLDALALLRLHARTGSKPALEAVTRQYDAMARGGIHDHLAGGFHRYSTDRNWETPHFEKMLYDQALIARVYLELCQVTGEQKYEVLCRDTLDFCFNRMRDRDGGFIAAFDATVGGEEGATYLWTKEEIEKVLPEGTARALFEHWAGFDRAKPGEKLTLAQRADGAESRIASDPSSASDFSSAKEALLLARDERPQPAGVNHVITSWNAWLVSTYARAAMVLNAFQYRAAALMTMAFLDANLRRPDGLYARRFIDGEARFMGELSDQAAVVEAMLDLHEMTLDPKWLDRATDLVPKIIEKFGRPDGSFDDSVEPDLIYRTHETSDGVVPSGVSQMNVALARIARMTGRPADLERARRAIQAVLADGSTTAADHAYGAIAWDLAFGTTPRIVFSGPRAVALALRAPLLLSYRPQIVMTVPAPGDRGPEDARASAVVWIDQSPSPPAFDSAELLKALDRPASRPESR